MTVDVGTLPAGGIDPTTRADRAIRLRLLGHLATAEEYLPRVRADVDPEDLHDFRVAIRRSRSLVSEMKDLFDPGLIRRYARELKWLVGPTGPVRDLDVLLESLPGYLEELPTDERSRFEPVRLLIEQRRASMQAAMMRHLDSERSRQFFHDWRSFLQEDDSEVRALVGWLPIGELMVERISRAARRVRKRSRQALRGDDPEALHELRIVGKRLRYLLDAFPELFDRPRTAKILKRLRGMQDVLGTGQDLAVHRQMVVDLASSAPSGSLPARSLVAVGRLVERLERRAERLMSDHGVGLRWFSDHRGRTAMETLLESVRLPAEARRLEPSVTGESDERNDSAG